MERVFAETISRTLDGLTGVTGTGVTPSAGEVRVELDAARTDERRVRPTLVDAGFPPA
jgi:copper chaperone CopZ